MWTCAAPRAVQGECDITALMSTITDKIEKASPPPEKRYEVAREISPERCPSGDAANDGE